MKACEQKKGKNMTNYKIFKPIKEGDSVQYVGVYVLEWKKEWGRPEVGFAEIEELPNSSGGYLDALLNISDYDCGLMNDCGGGQVSWWHDYIRYEINRCNEHWREEINSIIE